MKPDETLERPYMQRALDLAARGEGLTRPNPPVGAVVVRDGAVVGEGFHPAAGQPHAEVFALRAAGEAARGATLYVTLEPCSTWGRTPPCTEAIVAAGIARVVVASPDPNPKHAGRGLRWLRRRSIAVQSGVARAAGDELIAPFRRWIATGRPLLTLKLGMSADGRIADPAGTSRWITGAGAREWVQALRRRADAILIGAGTAVADDPSLLPRPDRGRRPFRVVVDSRGRLPARAKVLNDEAAERTIVAVTGRCPAKAARALARRGAQVVTLPADPAGRVSLPALMDYLGGMGLLHVLCEGGGELAAALVREELVDEFRLFLAPMLLGGGAVPALGGPGWALDAAPTLEFEKIAYLDGDLLVEARRAPLRGRGGRTRKGTSCSRA